MVAVDLQTKEREAMKQLAERKEYKPLIEMVSDVRAMTKDTLSSYASHNPPHALYYPTRSFAAVQKHLAERGVDKVAYVGHGSYALAFRLNDHEIGRLSSIREKKRPDLDAFLAPTYTADIGDLRLEILPQVDIKGASTQQARHLVSQLVENGYYPTDGFGGNVGTLTNGTPVIVDPDIAAKVPEVILPLYKPVMRTLHNVVLGRLDTSIQYDYRGAQEHHLKALGLEKGKIGIHNRADDIVNEPSSTTWLTRSVDSKKNAGDDLPAK